MNKISTRVREAFDNCTELKAGCTRITISEHEVVLWVYDKRVAFKNRNGTFIKVRNNRFRIVKERLNALKGVHIKSRLHEWQLDGAYLGDWCHKVDDTVYPKIEEENVHK